MVFYAIGAKIYQPIFFLDRKEKSLGIRKKNNTENSSCVSIVLLRLICVVEWGYFKTVGFVYEKL